MAQPDSRRAFTSPAADRGATTTTTPPELTDRQLLEEITGRLRRLQPLIDAAERHPFVRAFLRRI